MNMAGKLNTVGHDGVAAYLTIVGNMHISHNPVVVAHAGNANILGCARADRDIFTNGIAVADFQACRLALVFFVLRNAANGTKPIESIVGAYGGVAINDAMRSHDGAWSDGHMLAYDTVRPYRHIIGYLGTWRYDSGRVNTFCHCYSSRTRIAHISLASAATWPSTVACAVYLQMERLIRSAVTSSLSWSPGTTGRRKRAPSTPTR